MTGLQLDESKVPAVLRAVDALAAFFHSNLDRISEAEPLAVAHSAVYALTGAGFTIGDAPE